ncbi:hypothetical protein JCM1841_003216 [Sporobolomyces salmonicolor]
MLSRLKRRTASASYPDPPATADHPSPPADDPVQDSARRLPPSPTPSTRSRRTFTTPVKVNDSTHSLSPSRALTPQDRGGRSSRSSSFGSATSKDRRFTNASAPPETGPYGARSAIKVDDFGQGSLTLDHLTPQDGSAPLTLVVQAPELLAAPMTDGASGSTTGSSSTVTATMTVVDQSDLATPVPGRTGMDDRFESIPESATSSSIASAPDRSAAVALAVPHQRPRSHTTSEALPSGRRGRPSSSAYSTSGLDALAEINSPPVPSFVSSNANSLPASAPVSPPSGSRPPSRSVSRSGSRASSINSGLVEAHSLRPPSATSSISPQRSRRNTKSTPNGIAGALALSGVALASPSAQLRHPIPLARVATDTAGEGAAFGGRPSTSSSISNGIVPTRSRDSIESANVANGGATVDSDEGSIYAANAHEHAFLSMDQLGDFDDVVSQLGTGYAVASSKRNAEFHLLFKNIPDDDYLIEDYGCALQREILIQGRLYISEHHLSFNANIFGWVTSLTIPFAEVCSIEKRMTAYVIPNAIQVATMHARHTFASFLSRDTTYDLIGNIWRLVHPVVPTSAALPDHHDESDDGEPDDDAISDAGIASGVDQGVAEGSRVRRRLRGFRRPRGGTGESTGGSAAKRVAENEAGENGAKGGRGGGSGMASARPGSPRGAGGKTVEKVHPPTVDTCPTLKNLKEVCMDTVFPSAPEKIYNLMFTSGFMKDFWTENQKLMDLQIGDWAPQTSGSNLLARSFSYIKPLNGSIGPKQTKCLITDESAHVDFDDFVCVITTTRTPDVPSGSAFAVKTRTSMTWSKGNSCRVVVTTGVEWSKSSFIKGIIEKSCIDGQKTYHADLEKAMRAYIATHRNEFVEKGQDVDSTSLDPSRAGAEDGGAGGGSPVDGGAVATSTTSAGAGASIAADVAQNWATPLLEALEPVADLVAQQSLKTLALGVVVAVLVISNLWTLSSRPAKGASLHPAERGRYRQGAAGEASAGSRGGREGANDDPRSPNEVASAVRDVLQDYFAQAGRAAAVGVHESEGDQGAPAAPVGTKAWRVEVDEIEASLDRLEERITGLRASLRDVSVSSTAPAVEVD